MRRVKQAIGFVLLLGATSVLTGCSSPPVEESKPVQAGDGSEKPTAAGASGAGGASTPASTAQPTGKATTN